MTHWRWLTGTEYRWAVILRIVLKAALLFALLNLLWAWLQPLQMINRLSLYNLLIPGRDRLPYGEDPELSYSVSINSVPAMFASHVVSRPPAPDEFRVLLIGDSSVWGWLLRPDETLAGQINAGNYTTAAGRRVIAYNLGYPILSLTKDLLLLDKAMEYQPDFILWLVTLESFAPENQLDPPPVANNPAPIRDLIARYDLALDPYSGEFASPTFWEQTLVGQRRPLADWLRLQLYGFTYAATGIDQYYPPQYDRVTRDYAADDTWYDFSPTQPFTRSTIAFDVLNAGTERMGEVPFLLVNEPIYISSGANSDLRYNLFYPRWAYDRYRELLAETAAENGWALLDLWDAIDSSQFTDSPVHLTPQANGQLTRQIMPELLNNVVDG
jgi:hypothetical protein